MEQEVVLRRNAVFDIIYRKAMTTYVMYVPTALRWFMEVSLILMVRKMYVFVNKFSYWLLNGERAYGYDLWLLRKVLAIWLY